MSALTSGSATAIENQSITPASPRLSKVDLIAALAKELQRERMKGAGLVNLVEDAEQQVCLVLGLLEDSGWRLTRL